MTNDAFDRWLRAGAPPVREDQEARQLLLARLEERLEQRRRRQRRVAWNLGAVVLVFAALAFLDVNPLGSHSRDFVPFKGRRDVLINPSSGISAPITEDAPVEYWERYLDERAAGVAEFRGASFYGLHGQVHWVVDRAVRGDDRATTGQPDSNDESNMSIENMRVFLKYNDVFLDRIERGEATELPGVFHQVDGHDLWFQVWEMETPEGTLRYGVSMPPAGANPPSR